MYNASKRTQSAPQVTVGSQEYSPSFPPPPPLRSYFASNLTTPDDAPGTPHVRRRPSTFLSFRRRGDSEVFLGRDDCDRVLGEGGSPGPLPSLLTSV